MRHAWIAGLGIWMAIEAAFEDMYADLQMIRGKPQDDAGQKEFAYKHKAAP